MSTSVLSGFLFFSEKYYIFLRNTSKCFTWFTWFILYNTCELWNNIYFFFFIIIFNTWFIFEQNTDNVIRVCVYVLFSIYIIQKSTFSILFSSHLRGFKTFNTSHMLPYIMLHELFIPFRLIIMITFILYAYLCSKSMLKAIKIFPCGK